MNWEPRSKEVEMKLFAQPLSKIVTRINEDTRLVRAWWMIEDHYRSSDLCLERVALVSGITKNHLNVLLRQAIGFTVHQLLIRFRLLKAINMMADQNHSLLYTALENGFGSLSTFERNFRRFMKITPSAYKNGSVTVIPA